MACQLIKGLRGLLQGPTEEAISGVGGCPRVGDADLAVSALGGTAATTTHASPEMWQGMATHG